MNYSSEAQESLPRCDNSIDMFSNEAKKGKTMLLDQIAKAKIITMSKAKDRGCDCPVCGQFVKVYKRTINKAMAAQLATAYRKFGCGTSFHITDFMERGGGDFAKLRYWGLIFDIPNNKPFKKNSGRWIITGLGENFIKGLPTEVPKYVLIYNGKFLDFDGDEYIDFKTALGKSFNYQELMSA